MTSAFSRTSRFVAANCVHVYSPSLSGNEAWSGNGSAPSAPHRQTRRHGGNSDGERARVIVGDLVRVRECAFPRCGAAVFEFATFSAAQIRNQARYPNWLPRHRCKAINEGAVGHRESSRQIDDQVPRSAKWPLWERFCQVAFVAWEVRTSLGNSVGSRGRLRTRPCRSPSA